MFNLLSVIDWRVITSGKQQQVDIDNVQENYRWVTHDYTIGDLVYVEINAIYQKLDYNKHGRYILQEVFTNGPVWVQQGQVNELINIITLMSHFIEFSGHCP